MPRLPQPLPLSLGTSFTHAEALAAGVTPGRLRGRDLERPFHGVRMRPAPADETDDGPLALDRRRREQVRRRVVAVAPTLSPHAFFAGWTDAALWGAPLPDDFDPDGDLCVATPHPVRAPRGCGIRSHAVRPHLISTVDRGGVRVSSPATTWAMLGGECDERWLVIVGDHLVRVPRDDRGTRLPSAQLTTIERLRAAAVEPGRRHRSQLLGALDRVRVGSGSRLETDYRLDAEAAGLPPMELDVEIRDGGARLLGIADGVYPRYGVIVEVEGDHHRTSRRQWNRDIDRIAAFTVEGWDVTRLTGARVRGGTATDVVASALRRHGWQG